MPEVVSAKRTEGYRTVRLGEVTKPARENARVNKAYEEAKRPNGQHRGLIRRYAGEADRQVEKALRSVERRIQEHLAKIADPSLAVEPGTSAVEVGYLVNSYWPKEVETFRSEADVLRGILEERKSGR